MYYTYILISVSTGKLYIGHADNLVRRLEEHNSSNRKSSFTSKRGPWKILFNKEFEKRGEAMKFENYLKTLKSKKYILQKFCSDMSNASRQIYKKISISLSGKAVNEL